MSGDNSGLDVILEEPFTFADVRDLLGNPRKREEVLDLFILARAFGYKLPEIVDALQQRGYDTTRITNDRCEDVYRMKLGVAVTEVTAAMEMLEIQLQAAKTGDGRPNYEAYLEPKGKLHLAPARQREIFDQ